MKISASKKQLAKIISENGGWRGVANLAVFGKVSGRCYLLKTDEWPEYETSIKGFYINARDVIYEFPAAPFANWHQTILSRDEYFHLYPAPGADGWVEWKGGECPVEEDVIVDVKTRGGEVEFSKARCWNWSHEQGSCIQSRQIVAYRLHRAAREEFEAPELEPPKKTIEQLAADYRAKLAIAQQAQEEADSHRCGAEAALEKLYQAGLAIGLDIAIADSEPEDKRQLELVITDWRDLQVGDEVECLQISIAGDDYADDRIGSIGLVVATEEPGKSGQAVKVRFDDGDYYWIVKWRFIRRP